MVGENMMVLVMIYLALDWINHPFINEPRTPTPTPYYGLPHNLYINISLIYGILGDSVVPTHLISQPMPLTIKP